MPKYYKKIWILLSLAALTLTGDWVHADLADLQMDIQGLIARKEYSEAISRLDELLREQPENAEARFLRGVVYAQSGEQEQAIEIFRDLNERFPELAEPYNNLAVLHAARGDYEEARMALNRAVEIQPDYATAHGNMGDLYARLAAISYDKAYSLNPQNHRARLKSDNLKDMLKTKLPPVEDRTVTETAVTADQPTAVAPVSPRGDDHGVDAGAEIVPPPGAVATAAPRPPTAQKCFSIGPLDDDDPAARMDDWLKRGGAKVHKRSEEKDTVVNHKVYLPPQSSRSQARKLLAELKSKGMLDVLIISDGDLKNGISVGVFSRPESIRRRTAELAALGHETRVQPRYETRRQEWLEISVTPDDKVNPALFKADFPNHELSERDCER